MSELIHQPYEQLANHMSSEVLSSIMSIDDPALFYTRMSQVISGAIYEGIHIGLSAGGDHDLSGPAELLETYNAGIEEGKRMERGEI